MVGAAVDAGGGMMVLSALLMRGSSLWPISVGMLLAALGGIVWLYWPQVRGLRRGWQWFLPALRGMAMAALALSVLKPVVSRSRTVEDLGTVVVLLDKSLSMGVRDHGLGESREDRRRVLGRLLSIGDMLGRLPAGVRSKAVAGVSEDLRKLDSLAEDIGRARREVEYARLSGRDVRQAEGRLEQAIGAYLGAARDAEETAKSIGSKAEVISQLTKLAKSPRAERREEWIRDLRKQIEEAQGPTADSQAGIDEELYQSNQPVRWVCDELSRQSRLGLSWEVLAGSGRSLLSRLDRRTKVQGFAVGEGLSVVSLKAEEGGREIPMEAEGTGSDLSGGLRKVLERMGGRSLQAVVYFTDGRQVGASGSMSMGLLPAGVPIFTVDVSSEGLRDLAIEHVELPRAVYVGEALRVKVSARCLGLDIGRILGQAKLWSEGVSEASGPMVVRDGRLEAELKVSFDKPGIHRVMISVPVQVGEATSRNNQVERWVKVVSQRSRVLALTGSAGWDFRYMRNALLRSPFVQLREALIVPGYSGLAALREDILQQDVVVLNDISKGCLSLEQWDAIRDLVTRWGGSVIVIPGVGHLQEEYGGHVMSELLPYTASVRPVWRMWPGERAHYHVVAAEGAEDVTGLWLDGDGEAGKGRWGELPGFYRYLAMPELKANARVLLVEQESRLALLTESRVGAGRVLFMGLNETWRWRHGVGGGVQDRFWRMLLRHAAEEPYAMTSGPLYLDVERAVVGAGEGIHVRAKLVSRGKERLSPAGLELAVLRDGQTVRAAVLEPAGNGDDGRYAAVVSDLPAGEYELRAVARMGDRLGYDASLPVKVERSVEEELRNVSGDREFLQRLADASGGKCLELEEVGMLPELLSEAAARQSQRVEMHLWDSPYLFVFFLSCLAMEWAMRKRVGLA